MDLSIRAYAKHRNITDGAVRKAIKSGRITKTKNNKINPETADKQWSQNTDPAQIKETKNEQNTRQESSNNNQSQFGPTYHQSRTIKEAYNAKLTKLQFEKESQRLVSLDEIKITVFNATRITRDRILNIPDRVIPDLIGKTNIHEMKEVLKTELIKALEELSKYDRSQ